MDLTILYEKIRRHHGAINEIATRVNKHRHTVRAVLKGELRNIEIVKIAAEYVLEIEKKDVENQREVNSLLQQVEALAA